MALRGLPYMKFYVEDFLTDERLRECLPQAIGVYIMIMCVMHKSDDYGKIYLKQKDKLSNSEINNFATKLSKHLPWETETIETTLSELVEEGVLQIENDCLIQKRMVADNILSQRRAEAGRKGGQKNRIPQNAKGNV